MYIILVSNRKYYKFIYKNSEICFQLMFSVIDNATAERSFFRIKFAEISPPELSLLTFEYNAQSPWREIISPDTLSSVSEIKITSSKHFTYDYIAAWLNLKMSIACVDWYQKIVFCVRIISTLISAIPLLPRILIEYDDSDLLNDSEKSFSILLISSSRNDILKSQIYVKWLNLYFQ